MKKLLLFAILIPAFSFGQTNKTTTMAGDFLNPLIWSPVGIPASGDSLLINHAVVLNTSIYYTAGRITISGSGSLIEDATDRSYWADGTGSLVNMGTFTAHLLLVSPAAAMTNMGNFAGVDSVWNQGTLMNMGSMTSYDVLNDETGTFHNHGMLFVNNDMNNQGYFHTSNTAGTTIGHDFSNCNIQTMDAWFENNGYMCIGNDFANCAGDTLTGIGDYTIGGAGTNLGVFEGTFSFNSPTGSITNLGTIDPNVTFGTNVCEIGLEEQEIKQINAFPNPTKDFVQINRTNVGYTVYDVTGQIVSKGTAKDGKVDLEKLNRGLYLLKVSGEPAIRVIKQ